jgi:hypothetical protein
MRAPSRKIELLTIEMDRIMFESSGKSTHFFGIGTMSGGDLDLPRSIARKSGNSCDLLAMVAELRDASNWMMARATNIPPRPQGLV